VLIIRFWVSLAGWTVFDQTDYLPLRQLPIHIRNRIYQSKTSTFFCCHQKKVAKKTHRSQRVLSNSTAERILPAERNHCESDCLLPRNLRIEKFPFNLLALHRSAPRGYNPAIRSPLEFYDPPLNAEGFRKRQMSFPSLRAEVR